MLNSFGVLSVAPLLATALHLLIIFVVMTFILYINFWFSNGLPSYVRTFEQLLYTKCIIEFGLF